MERCLIYDIRHIWLQIARLRESSPAINKKKKIKKEERLQLYSTKLIIFSSVFLVLKQFPRFFETRWKYFL